MVTLEAKKLPTIEPPNWDYFCYTVKDDQLLRTCCRNQGLFGFSDVKGGATCTLGTHPFAKELQDWGMETTSVVHSYLPTFQFILPRAQERLPLHRLEHAHA
jgi:hypothetical protein